MDDMDEIVKEFLVESSENLDTLDQQLVSLEKDPGNKEIINTIFRIVHTIKGTCGFLGFSKLESVTHKGESLLDSLRAERLRMSGDIATALLKVADAIRTFLITIEESGNEGQHDFTDLVQTLVALNAAEVTTTQQTIPSTPVLEDVTNYELLAELTAELEAEKASAQASITQPSATKLVSNTENKTPSNEAAKATTATAIADTSLRVDVVILDKLMNLVSELVLARNQIIQYTRRQSDPELLNSSQRLNLITSELQEGVMRTRMQPIENVWNKFPRVVRDVARSCGKEVRIEMEGKETDLDKTLIEAIKDPLTHIIRNSVDHGIEKPEERVKNGKPREGVLKLKAYHEGGYVIIEIADDGAGLNTDRIRKKALEKGVITLDQAERMSEQEVHMLIFAAGFSTAEQVTNISGRGVGMDVVRSNIQKIGGVVDVSSVSGKGTLLRIKIPLTLAIVPALIISCHGQRFAIPQVSLVELVRIPHENTEQMLEAVDAALFYRLRGNLLPLVQLDKQLKLSSSSDLAGQTIVVIRSEDGLFGLVVESIHDTEEIVVKPLSKRLKDVKVFSGATIMGDGKVALILDVGAFAQYATNHHESVANLQHDQVKSMHGSESSLNMLLMSCGQGQLATPLSDVHRLENLKASELEFAGGCAMIQYRGSIMPLYNIATLLGRNSDVSQASKAESIAEHSVVVYSHNGRSVGLMVDQIIDIVDQKLNIDLTAQRQGVRGTAVLAGKVTEVIDLAQLAELTDHLSCAGANGAQI